MEFATPEGDQAITVLVVTNHILLGEILEDVLAQETSLNVCRVAPHQFQNWLQERGQHCPLVIIIEETVLTDTPYDLTRQIERNGRVHLLIISSEHNKISDYRGYQRDITNITDLIAIITTFINQT